MRLKPTFSYNGLTVVLSQQSRFDLDVTNPKQLQLLSGQAGHYFNQDCLGPITNRYQCDIRTADTIGEGLLEGTKGVFLLGERSFREWSLDGYLKYSLNQQRGYLIAGKFGDIPTIASYSPQDCMDLVDHEGRLNPLLANEEDETEKEKDSEDEKNHSTTRRQNYKFWLLQDTKKILLLTNRGIPKEPEVSYNIYPNSSEVIEILSRTKGETLFFDIETDPLYQITCFSFSFGDTIYVVPLIRYNYSLAYDTLSTARIFRALVLALSTNCVCIHNSLYDLFILAWKYKIPCSPDVYDTMLAFHRLFPESEKSLGHVLSWCSYQSYHKDEGGKLPWNSESEQKYWMYNGKDVYSLILVKAAIDEYSKNDQGLKDSIVEANERVQPYLINTLLGIKFDDKRRQEMMAENDKLMMQYFRCIRLLAGEKVLPTSNKQMVKFFHDRLRYKTVKVSKRTGKPSLDGDALYKLKLRYPDNWVIDFAIKYRERGKESGVLRFKEWRKP